MSRRGGFGLLSFFQARKLEIAPMRSRISGGTKWLGLRSKSKSPKFGADRKHYYPDDDTA